MNINEIISSGLLESYVLGTATTEENALINQLCKKHPELVREIELIEEGLINFSGKADSPLNPELKSMIQEQLSFTEAKPAMAEARVVELHAPVESRLNLYKFGIAASIVMFIVSFIYNIMLQKELSKVNGELAELGATKSYMADELKIQQASFKNMNDRFGVVSNPKTKTVALNGMNYLAKSSAAVHWNTETDEVYFNAAALPGSPANKQYQLWAIVEGKPVDMGMIDMGSSTAVFQKMKAVKGAQAFAVTIEDVGGSAAPTLETMCLLGNV